MNFEDFATCKLQGEPGGQLETLQSTCDNTQEAFIRLVAVLRSQHKLTDGEIYFVLTGKELL